MQHYIGNDCMEAVDRIQRQAVKRVELYERDLRNILKGHEDLAVHHDVVIMSRARYDRMKAKVA